MLSDLTGKSYEQELKYGGGSIFLKWFPQNFNYLFYKFNENASLSVKIFSVTAQHGTVSRKCVTTRNTTETLSGLLRPTALALDWVRENIYVVERGGAHTVKVCHFGVQRCAVIVTSPSHISVDTLAVDPINK